MVIGRQLMLHPGTPRSLLSLALCAGLQHSPAGVNVSVWELCWDVLTWMRDLIQCLILGPSNPHEIQGFQNIPGSALKSEPCFIHCHSTKQDSCKVQMVTKLTMHLLEREFPSQWNSAPPVLRSPWDNTEWHRARLCRRAQDAHSICWVLLSHGAEGNWEGKHPDLHKRSLWYNQSPSSVLMGWSGDAIEVSGSCETPQFWPRTHWRFCSSHTSTCDHGPGLRPGLFFLTVTSAVLL